MSNLVFLLGITLWSAAVGLFILRRFGPLPDSRADTLAQAIPLGLGALGLSALGLGEIGELDHGRLETVLGIGTMIAAPGFLHWVVKGFFTTAIRDRATKPGFLVPTLRVGMQSGTLSVLGFRRGTTRSVEDGIPTQSVGTSSIEPHKSRVDLSIALLVAATLLGTLLTALAPVTDGDALCYHLQVPKVFLEKAAVTFDPDLHETVYPLLTEMLYAVGLALQGPVACRLIQWLLGVVFAMNVTALARPSLGSRAWWAGAIALLVPAVSNGMSAPLNDVALAAFGTAAIVAWMRFQDHRGFRNAALTGVFTGLAMGVKYPALVLAGLIGASIGPGFISRLFWRATTGGMVSLKSARAVTDRLVNSLASPDDAAPRKRRWGGLLYVATFVAFAWMVGGCWYLRAFVHTGNPVHPFFRSAFGGAGLDEVLGPEKRPLPVDALSLLSALGPMTLRPDVFDSFSHQFGPIFLLFLPALFLERPPRRVLSIAAFGYGFLMLCATQRQSMRFVLTAIGPMSVAVAWLLKTWWERKTLPGRVLVAAVLIALGFESTLAVARARHGLGVVFGLVSTDDYLASREPTFKVGQWVAENLPPSAKLVGQDHRGFYFPRPYTMELAHRRRTNMIQTGEAPEAVIADLRKAGFTHLVMCPPVPETAVEFDPTLGRVLAPWLDQVEPLYREELKDADGVPRRYAIYSLGERKVASTTTSTLGTKRR